MGVVGTSETSGTPVEEPDDPRDCSRCETLYEGAYCAECFADEVDRRYDERKEEGTA